MYSCRLQAPWNDITQRITECATGLAYAQDVLHDSTSPDSLVNYPAPCRIAASAPEAVRLVFVCCLTRANVALMRFLHLCKRPARIGQALSASLFLASLLYCHPRLDACTIWAAHWPACPTRSASRAQLFHAPCQACCTWPPRLHLSRQRAGNTRRPAPARTAITTKISTSKTTQPPPISSRIAMVFQRIGFHHQPDHVLQNKTFNIAQLQLDISGAGHVATGGNGRPSPPSRAAARSFPSPRIQRPDRIDPRTGHTAGGIARSGLQCVAFILVASHLGISSTIALASTVQGSRAFHARVALRQRFDPQSKARQSFATSSSRAQVRGRQIHDFGDQQGRAANTVFRHSGVQLFHRSDVHAPRCWSNNHHARRRFVR